MKSHYGKGEKAEHTPQGHTGDVTHGSHLMPVSGKDSQCCDEHHEANKLFEMHDGMAPKHNAGQSKGTQHGVPETSHNCTYED